MDPRSVVSVLRASAIALLVLLVSVPAKADRHTGDLGGGGGRSGRSGLWGAGVVGSLVPGWPCSATGTAHRKCDLSLAGEVAWAQGDHDKGTLTQWVFQAGPRFMMYPSERFQPFLEVLPGASVEKLHGVSDTSFSISLGGGWDMPFHLDHPVWVLRAEASWNWIQNGRSDDSYWKFGISVLYRFGEKDMRAQRPAPASK
jgi:hypothetical protein